MARRGKVQGGRRPLTERCGGRVLIRAAQEGGVVTVAEGSYIVEDQSQTPHNVAGLC